MEKSDEDKSEIIDGLQKKLLEITEANIALKESSFNDAQQIKKLLNTN